MKTQFILAAVLSVATVSAIAAPHHHRQQPPRNDRVTVINHHHYYDNHRVVQPRRVAPTPRYARSHYRPAPPTSRHVVTAPPAPRVHYAPPLRPIPHRPTANFSLSVNL